MAHCVIISYVNHVLIYLYNVSSLLMISTTLGALVEKVEPQMAEIEDWSFR